MASAEQFHHQLSSGSPAFWLPPITPLAASAHLNPMQFDMSHFCGIPQPFSFLYNPYNMGAYMNAFGLTRSENSPFMPIQKPLSDMSYPSDQNPIYGGIGPITNEDSHDPVAGQTCLSSTTGSSSGSVGSPSSIESSIDAVLGRHGSPTERSAQISPESVASAKSSAPDTVELRPLHLDTTSSSSSYSDCGTGGVSPCSSASRSTPGSLLTGDLNVKCSICEDRASGYHYGVTSCEGCKGFFRRTVQKNIEYSCHKDGNCAVNRITRNRCQSCRFKKCCQKGMAKEAVRNDRNRKRKIKDVQEEEQLRATARLQQLITKVVATHNDTSESVAAQLDDTKVDILAYLRDQVLGPGLRNIIQFGTSLPGYQELVEADQITLLKSAILEILILRSAFVLCAKDVSWDASAKMPDLFHTVSNAEMADCVIRLKEFLVQLQVYQEEIALLSAICLFCPTRHGLVEPEKVEKLQEGLLESLRIQVQLRKPSQPHVFAKLLMKISDLRSLVLKAGNAEVTIGKTE